MAKGGYIGVSSTARRVKKIYIGQNGVAKRVKKAYIGVGGKAKLFFSAFSGTFLAASFSGLSHTTYDGTNASTSTHGINDLSANVSLVYCNGYWWGSWKQGDNNRSNRLVKSPDLVSWTSSMAGAIDNTVDDTDGSILADDRYLYIRLGQFSVRVLDTQTNTYQDVFRSQYYLTGFAILQTGKIILSWSYSGTYYYTIYDATTNTQTAMTSMSKQVRFPNHATSEDRVIAINLNDSVIGYFKNNAFTFGSAIFYGSNIGYNGFVYGNGKFTTGYATSTDGLTWSTTLDGQNRAVIGFGGGLFIRFYRQDNTSLVMSLQTSEDGINWTTVKADIPTGTASGQSYGILRRASVAFKPI